MATATASGTALCLVAPAGQDADWRARVEAALDVLGATTLILTAPADGPLDPAAARPLVQMAQQRSIAALIANDIPAARATGADGVHLSWRPEIEDAYEVARGALGPDAIVGAEAGLSRHDAMTLGEAGADYVAFGRMTGAAEPDEARDAQREMIAWWTEVFVVPAVALDAETAEDVRTLSAEGADFVGVRLPRAAPAEGDRAWAEALVAAVGAPAGAT